jgi:hypothetical protein
MAKKFLPPIHIACSDDEISHSLMHVEVLDGIATATNGHLIVRLNLAEHSSLDDMTIKRLSGKYIHRDIWHLLHDAENIYFNNEGDVITYIKGGIEAEIRIKSEVEIKFPNYQELIRKIANTRFEKKSFIAFNPEWVTVAKKIFNTQTLILRFYEQENMFTIFPGGDAKAFMGVMPNMITEEDAVFDFSLT